MKKVNNFKNRFSRPKADQAESVSWASFGLFSSIWLLGMAVLFTACATNQSPETLSARTPVVVVIGQDISQTFVGNAQLTRPLLDSLLNVLAQSECSVTVAYSYIGNPGNRSFLRCTLAAIPVIDATLTIDRLAEARHKQTQIRQTNRQAIESFLTQWQQVNSASLHQKTDLNAFFRSVSNVLSEAQFDGSHKYLLVNSDGMHDLGNGSVLQCDWPVQTTVCLSGWVHPQLLCKGETQPLFFESINGFEAFLTKKQVNHEL